MIIKHHDVIYGDDDDNGHLCWHNRHLGFLFAVGAPGNQEIWNLNSAHTFFDTSPRPIIESQNDEKLKAFFCFADIHHSNHVPEIHKESVGPEPVWRAPVAEAAHERKWFK